MNQKRISYEFLYLFRDIMRCGSIERAAKELGSSSAIIGKKVAQAEEDLNMTFFVPDSGGMVPTAAGLYLYDKLDTILWNIDATLQQARAIPGEDSMKLNLAISDMISGDIYRRVIKHYTKNHPGIHYTLSAPSTPDMRRKLTDGRIDAAITYSVGFADVPGLSRKTILSGKPCIYYHKDILQEADEKLNTQSFCDCTFVCLNTDVAARNMLRELPFEPKKVIFSDTLKSLWLYVTAGLACTILGPQHMRDINGISAYELTESDYTMGVDLVWETSNMNPAIGLLADTIDKLYLQKDND